MDTTILILVGIGLLILALFGTVFWMLTVSGLFEKIDVHTRKKHLLNAPKVMAYKSYTGNYKQVGDAFSWLVNAAPFSDTIGIYYDDPQKVGKDKCRYAVGAVVEPCGDKMTLEELVKRLEDEEYKFFKLPGSDPDDGGSSDAKSDKNAELVVTPMVHCVFPFVNTLSILIAVRRVYPALQKYIEEHKLVAHPFMECCHDGQMNFLVPCANNNRYYIPEFCEENQQFGAEKYSELIENDKKPIVKTASED